VPYFCHSLKTLPRHLCVCKECFPHIDKCPVCRSQFDDYVTVRHDRLISVKAPKCVQRKGRQQGGGSGSGESNLKEMDGTAPAASSEKEEDDQKEENKLKTL
jgi:hypothetical protein